MLAISIISFCAITFSFLIGIYIYLKRPEIRLNQIFMLICLLVTSAGIAEMGYILSLDSETAKFWAQITFIKYLFFPLALHFMLIFTKNRKWLDRKITYLFIYALPICFIVLDIVYSRIMLQVAALNNRFTIAGDSRVLGIISSAWSLGLSLLMLYICYKYYKRATNKKNKIQARFLFIGFVLLILFSLASDYILPEFGITVPILSSFSLSFVVFIIFPAVSKHNLFSFSARSEADKIIATMSDLMLIIDTTGMIVDVNPAICDTLGFTRRELLGEQIGRLVPSGIDFEKILSGMSYSKEYMQWEFITKNNEHRFISCSLSKFYDDYDECSGIVFIGRDMTTLRDSIKKLKEQDNRYRMLFNSGNDMILVFSYAGNRPGRLLEVNDKACEELGYTRDEFYRSNVFDLFNPKMDLNMNIFQERIFKLKRMINEIEFMSRKGKAIPFETSSRLFEMDGEYIVMMVSRNITERNMTQEMLAVMETAIDTSINAIFFTDILGNVNWVNNAFLELFGYDTDDIVNSRELKSFFKESTEMLREIHEKGRFTGDVHSIERSGGEKVLHLGASSFHHQSGSEIGIMGSCIDITDRVIAERELEQSRSNYMDLVEKANIGIIIENNSNEIIYYNDMFLKLFGYDFSEVDKLSFARLIDEDSLEAFMHMHTEVRKNGATERRVELQAMRKNGAKLYIAVDAIAIEEQGRGIRYYIWDETEQHIMKRELLRVQKLESLGLLAGGIAHDFNNVLTGILGNISLARLSISKGSKEYKLLSESELATARARDLTQQLLTFSRGGMPVKETSSIANILHDTVEFIIRGTNIKAEFDIDSDLSAAEVDRGQFSQVLNNIVINSIHAMPDGGNIKILALNKQINSRRGLPLEPGDYVVIKITDNGIGISADNQKRIFEPYFTTKDKGTGLGLATSYSIVKKHDGHITVKSRPGKGACFTIYLPASENVPKPIIRDVGEESIKVIDGMKILVMDDELIIRDIAQGMLEHFGYTVNVAENGEKAIESYQQAIENNCPFDAVIFDLTVPGGMGGREALEKLQMIDPNIIAIVSSGYSNDRIMSEYASYGFADVVVKPYEAEKLLNTIHRVLENKNKRVA